MIHVTIQYIFQIWKKQASLNLHTKIPIPVKDRRKIYNKSRKLFFFSFSFFPTCMAGYWSSLDTYSHETRNWAWAFTSHYLDDFLVQSYCRLVFSTKRCCKVMAGPCLLWPTEGSIETCVTWVCVWERYGPNPLTIFTLSWYRCEKIKLNFGVTAWFKWFVSLCGCNWIRFFWILGTIPSLPLLLLLLHLLDFHYLERESHCYTDNLCSWK